jgi:hypothetical protein
MDGLHRCLLTLLLLAACTAEPMPAMEESETTSDASTDTTGPEPAVTTETGAPQPGTTDAASSESSTGSTEDSSGGEIACADALVLDETFEIDPDGVTTQIQASVWFDTAADGVWMVYNLPADDGSGVFDVHVTRMHCDGSHQLPPRRINATDGRNDIDGELARLGDDVLVVWSSDDGVSPVGNVQILAMGLDPDGEPTFDADVILQTSYEGEPVTGSAWMPHLRTDGDAFVLVGTRGIEALSAFQMFVQRLDAQAGLLGDAAAPPVEPGVSHQTADLAVLTDGALAAAWAGSDATQVTQVRHATVVDGAFVPDPPPLLLEADASGPALATDPTGTGAYLAVSVEDGAGRVIHVARAEPGDATAPIVLGDGLSHTPSLASGPTGAGVAWYENISGIRNELWVARIVDDGDTLTATAEQSIPDAVAAPYASTITRVVGDVYFVAWSQGESPDLRLYGRFVDLGD